MVEATDKLGIIEGLSLQLQRLQRAQVVARYRGPHHVLGMASAASMALLVVLVVLDAHLSVLVVAGCLISMTVAAFSLTYYHALRHEGLEQLCAWTVTIKTRAWPDAVQPVRSLAGSSAGQQPGLCNCDETCPCAGPE